MKTNQEMPSVIFRRILPFVSQKDMKNVELAVRASPKLYNEYSFFTKKDSKKSYAGPLICPYCLIGSGFFNIWHKILMCIFGMNQRTWGAASVGVEVFESEHLSIVEAKSFASLKELLVERDAPMVAQGTAENRFRRWTQIWTEEYNCEKKAKRLLVAAKDLVVFNSAYLLVKHIESAHHPTGAIWRSLENPIQRLGHVRIRAHELDEISSLITRKEFRGAVVAVSPRKNQNFKNSFKNETAARRRRHGHNQRFLNPPTSFLTQGNDKTQNLHRTLALAYLLEDKIFHSNKQYLVVPQQYHKLLALRNFLACQIQVYEEVEFGFLSMDNACYFGLINSVKIILDSIIQLPY